MAKELSPSLGNELRAAGVDVNKGLGWNAQGDLFNLGNYTKAEQDAITKVIAAHAPGAVALPRSTAMWRARAIMKVTPWGEGTLFDAVTQAVSLIGDPLTKAAAEEALERGTVFDMDGQLVPLLAGAIGIDESVIQQLVTNAEALPA